MLNDPQLIAGRTIERYLLNRDPDVALLTDDQIQQLAASVRHIIGPLIRDAEKHRAGVRHTAQVLDMYRKPGIVDPAASLVHNASTLEHTDFGLVSLGPNPFSAAAGVLRACIFAAGIHGPGTAQAVRMLGAEHTRWFIERPFGGVMKVNLDLYKDWPARFDEAIPDWVTPEYTSEALCANFAASLSEPTHPLHLKTSRACIAFLEAIVGARQPLQSTITTVAADQEEQEAV
jgi:hypothetical protein